MLGGILHGYMVTGMAVQFMGYDTYKLHVIISWAIEICSLLCFLIGWNVANQDAQARAPMECIEVIWNQSGMKDE